MAVARRAAQKEGACCGFQRQGARRVILVRVSDQDIADGSGSGVDERLDVHIIGWAGVDDGPVVAGADQIAVGAGTGHRAWIACCDANDAGREADRNTGLDARIAGRTAPVSLSLAHLADASTRQIRKCREPGPLPMSRRAPRSARDPALLSASGAEFPRESARECTR